jgi:hypothetical protein
MGILVAKLLCSGARKNTGGGQLCDWKPVIRKGLPIEPVGAGDASPFQPETVVTQLPERPVTGGAAPEKITLVPYGCTKFRVSMFPVTEGAYKVLETGKSVRPRGTATGPSSNLLHPGSLREKVDKKAQTLSASLR